MLKSGCSPHPVIAMSIIEAAEKYCAARGAKLTEIRRQVLELVLRYPDVIKAYDVLADLQRIRSNAAPPTVYRALDFLVEMGILHRTESLNGFVFCPHFADEHSAVILSCRACGHVEETHAEAQFQQLRAFCKAQDFELGTEALVLSGLCRECLNEHGQ